MRMKTKKTLIGTCHPQGGYFVRTFKFVMNLLIPINKTCAFC